MTVIQHHLELFWNRGLAAKRDLEWNFVA
jgi:hypothetical protein